MTPAVRDLFDSGAYTFVFYLSEFLAQLPKIKVWFPMDLRFERQFASLLGLSLESAIPSGDK
eukprot:CAMPEP_0204907808 /NCGR_PEP_ID=MMETSP1397-20131031/6871_1 /ASSEMBLY_ACC=CAM_ASM_000891 /TAXON_ID=49980 /ORGANISM="Climacostomum Climacostomum virens, Strain Stock W-24" /LENGTH=61 /DNA_ID=CAMNT_0052077081 /DNA_START=144 /DNA_END=326 /DNA_ORIENTATION=-